MNSTLRIEVCRVFARMWRNCSPIAFYRAQTTVKFLSKWIDSPIRLPFQIVCVWKPTIDGIGGRFSVREHSSRFFNFASANRNASERTLSIDTKTRTGNENENENEAEGGNDSLNADNDNQSQLTYSLDLHSPLPYHKTPSWNTGIARSVERVRSFDLHRSVDSLNSDSYLFLLYQPIECRLRRDTPSPIMSPRATPLFPRSAMQYQMIPTHYMIRLLIHIRSTSQENDSIRVLHVTLQWNPQEATLIDLVNRLLEHLSLSLSYASSILQTINNAISKVSYLQGPFLQDNPRIERIDVKSLQATLRLSLAFIHFRSSIGIHRKALRLPRKRLLLLSTPRKTAHRRNPLVETPIPKQSRRFGSFPLIPLCVVDTPYLLQHPVWPVEHLHTSEKPNKRTQNPLCCKNRKRLVFQVLRSRHG